MVVAVDVVVVLVEVVVIVLVGFVLRAVKSKNAKERVKTKTITKIFHII